MTFITLLFRAGEENSSHTHTHSQTCPVCVCVCVQELLWVAAAAVALSSVT